MLRGAHAVTLDSKGRITIPTRYRSFLAEECEGKFVCTIDIQHPCLLLFPLNKWEVLEKKLSRLSSINEHERRLQRLLLGNAIDCESDSNGRVLITPVLREHASLEKNIMLVGQLNRFEIWSETHWKETISSDMEKLSAATWSESEGLKGFTLNDTE